MRYITFCSAIALLTSFSGCSGFTDLAISARNHSAAYKAWKGARWSYFEQGVECRMREHIGRGFQQGYYDVANGGNGDLPLFPPTYYWGPEYQNPEGNGYIAAWFRGYTDGALAADRAGIAGYHNLPTSWSPPYANDPDSPDGGYTPYRAPNTLDGNNNNNAPVEGIPPGQLDAAPQLPLPVKPDPKPPIPKSVNTPVPPGLQREAIEALLPTEVTPLDATAPALTAPNLDVKVDVPVGPTTPTAPTEKAPAVKPPAGKQTYFPPGNATPPLTSDAKQIPQVVETPKVDAVKK